ncbi:MAG: hypothetical protein ACE37B_14470 [Ilumatobacter sp.]|uniref:hypothetical protein n=1 Tax=Ilumatobacter sp. TaxID=1967498 RepID=UPI00391DDB27
MNLFRHIEADYRRIARDGLPDQWCTGHATLDDVVEAIRDHREHQGRSDDLTRHLATIARTDHRAVVVVLYALAPLLGARLGRAVTTEYRTDALTELAMVILDSPLDGPRLAHRLVNRAHTRVYKAARRVEHRGVVHIVQIAPVDPQRMLASDGAGAADIADGVTDRLALARFNDAVLKAVDSGTLSPNVWAAYRDHRLQRALDPSGPTSTAVQRKLASRAASRLQPLVDQYLHAA